MPGRKRKPTILKLIEGNRGHRPLNLDEPIPDGPIERPAKLKGRAAVLWDSFIARAHWLTWADGAKALMWCHLQAEFERSPKNMVASRIAQLRAVGSELGFDPASRAGLGAPPHGEKKDTTGKYF